MPFMVIERLGGRDNELGGAAGPLLSWGGMGEGSTAGSITGAALRLLTFRTGREEFPRFDYRHLAFGVAATWVAGVGRRWDDPGASLLQHLGVGSVVYVFVPSLLLWAAVRPLWPREWSYGHVLRG